MLVACIPFRGGYFFWSNSNFSPCAFLLPALITAQMRIHVRNSFLLLGWWKLALWSKHLQHQETLTMQRLWAPRCSPPPLHRYHPLSKRHRPRRPRLPLSTPAFVLTALVVRWSSWGFRWTTGWLRQKGRKMWRSETPPPKTLSSAISARCRSAGCHWGAQSQAPSQPCLWLWWPRRRIRRSCSCQKRAKTRRWSQRVKWLRASAASSALPSTSRPCWECWSTASSGTMSSFSSWLLSGPHTSNISPSGSLDTQKALISST